MSDDKKGKGGEQEGSASIDAGLDSGNLAQRVLRESYTQNQKDLRLLADKQRRINKQKKALRDYIVLLRQARSTALERARAAKIDLCKPDSKGEAALARLFREVTLSRKPADKEEELVCYELCIPETAPPAGTSSFEQLDALTSRYEVELQTVGDDSELSLVALQQAMNQQSQLLQTLSSILKNQHDTAKSIIQNMK